MLCAMEQNPLKFAAIAAVAVSAVHVYAAYRNNCDPTSARVCAAITDAVLRAAPSFTSSKDRVTFRGTPVVLETTRSGLGGVVTVVEYEPDESDPEECKYRVMVHTTTSVFKPPGVYVRTVIRPRSAMSPRSTKSKWMTISPVAELATTRCQLACLAIAKAVHIEVDKVLILGLGDGCLVNLLEYSRCMGEWDHLGVTAVEADPVVLAMAEKHCGLPKNLQWTDNIKQCMYDTFLADPANQGMYDVVYLTNISLFGGFSNGTSMASVLTQVKAALSTGGLTMVVAEVSFATLAEARAILGAFRKVFPPSLHVFSLTSTSLIVAAVSNPFAWVTKDATKEVYYRLPGKAPIPVLQSVAALRTYAGQYLAETELAEMFETRKDNGGMDDPNGVVCSAYRVR